MSILFVHTDDVRRISDLSAIVHANKTHPYISCGVTIKKLQGGDRRINTAIVGGTQDSLENWIRTILPPPQTAAAPSRSYVQRPAQQAPIAQQPVYSQSGMYIAPQSQSQSHSQAQHHAYSQQNTHSQLSAAMPPPKAKNPHIYTRANAQRSTSSQPSGPPPSVGQVSMADVFASQLTGTRGDEEGFSARDAKFIAGLMCESATIGANQI